MKFNTSLKKKMKSFIALTVIVFCSCAIWSCNQEEAPLLADKYQYSENEIAQIEGMIKKYNVDATIYYESKEGHLLSLQEIDKLLQGLSEIQNSLNQIKEIPLQEDLSLSFWVGENKNFHRLLKKGGETYTGKYSASSSCELGNLHFTFHWENFDLQSNDEPSISATFYGNNNNYTLGEYNYSCQRNGSSVKFSITFEIIIEGDDEDETIILGTFSASGSFDIIKNSK